MKKLVWGLAAGIVALPLVFLGRAAAKRQQEEAPGEVVRVARRTIGSSVKATGVVKPRIGAEVKVGSRVSGVVARLHVQQVKALEHEPRSRGSRPGRRPTGARAATLSSAWTAPAPERRAATAWA